jgi:hypothetical protein
MRYLFLSLNAGTNNSVLNLIFAGAGATELQALLRERMSAMEITDTLQRLHKVTEHAMLTRSSLAAKVALQSLQS